MSGGGMLHLGGARTTGQPVRTQNGKQSNQNSCVVC